MYNYHGSIDEIVRQILCLLGEGSIISDIKLPNMFTKLVSVPWKKHHKEKMIKEIYSPNMLAMYHFDSKPYTKIKNFAQIKNEIVNEHLTPPPFNERAVPLVIEINFKTKEEYDVSNNHYEKHIKYKGEKLKIHGNS